VSVSFFHTVDRIGIANVIVDRANTSLMKFSGEVRELRKLNKKLPTITHTMKVANMRPCGNSIGVPSSGCIAGVHIKTNVNIAPSKRD